MRPLLSLSLVVLVCAALPARSDFDAGMRAYEASDYATAFKEWQPLAEAGDARAQFELAGLYWDGEGTEKNYSAALAMYKKSAKQYFVPSVYSVGYMKKHGQGTPPDREIGKCFIETAARNGNIAAQWSLCHDEEPAALFFMESIDWCKRAAAQGSPAALYRLGQVYLFHPDVPDAKGFMHVILAARLGDEIAIDHMKEVREDTDTGLQARIRQGEEMADGWRAVREAPPDPLVRVPDHCWFD